MRRRTKPRVVWLPNTNANSLDLLNLSTFQEFVHTVAGAIGDSTVSATGVVIDTQADPLASGQTLSDVESSGYRLRRLVGKIWCTMAQSGGGDATPASFICTAGFIILRTDANNAGVTAQSADRYDPGRIATNDSPWIWRRSWILSNPQSDAASVFTNYPFTNAEYGSVADGPHVDQKTARIVSQDERLFLVCSTTILEAGDPQLSGNVLWNTDMRVLASMRTSSGNRRNASR